MPKRKHKSLHWSWQRFLGYDTKSTDNKSKNRQMGLQHTLKILSIKGPSEKATYGMAEMLENQKYNKIQNIKNSYNSTTNNHPNPKMRKECE